MTQQRSVRRRLSSAVSGIALAAGVLTVSALTGQSATAAPSALQVINAQRTSVSEDFTGWQHSKPQDGWTIDPTPSLYANSWGFVDTSFNRPQGSEGTFAGVYGRRDSAHQEYVLTTPAVDLTGKDSPVVEFDSSFFEYVAPSPVDARVELSLDGGQTWSAVWRPEAVTGTQKGHVTAPIPQAAGESDVVVRFHFTGRAIMYGSWSIDNVFIGAK